MPSEPPGVIPHSIDTDMSAGRGRVVIGGDMVGNVQAARAAQKDRIVSHRTCAGRAAGRAGGRGARGRESRLCGRLAGNSRTRVPVCCD